MRIILLTWAGGEYSGVMGGMRKLGRIISFWSLEAILVLYDLRVTVAMFYR
jgi:hypothetical protein